MTAKILGSGLGFVAAGILLMPLAVWADDFVVDTPSTVTNDGNVLDGGDSLAVKSSGSIMTSAGSAVSVTGTGNSIINDGVLFSSSAGDDGITSAGGTDVVNNGTISTAGAFIFGFFGDDDETVVNNGLVTTSGDISDAIYVRDMGLVINNGTITTSGFNSFGIFIVDNNVVINNGTISTSGEAADAISGSDPGDPTATGSDNHIINTGVLSTTGDEAYGILLNRNNVIENSGTITTSGEDAFAISLVDDNIVSNSGIIRVLGAEDFDIDAIEVGDSNMVTNSGFIETFGAGSDGIDGDDDNIFINTGRILVHGAGAEALDVDDDSTITNSGSLISVQGNSIEINGTGNSVNLLAPSFLGGAIDFGGNTGAINITTGASQSVAWSLPLGSLVGGMPDVSGSVPFVYDGAVFATVDPTVLTSIYDAMGQRDGLLFDVMQMRQNQRGDRTDVGDDGAILAYAREREAAAAQVIDATFGGLPGDRGPTYWATTIGAVGQVDENGTFTRQVLAHGGAAAGVDAAINAQTTAGVMAGYLAGYAHGMTPFSTSFENQTQSGFVGAYGRWQQDGFFIDMAATLGASAHADRRLVNDNLAPLGVSWADANYGSAWIAPEIAAGFSYQLDDEWVATPSVRLQGAVEWVGGYADTGTIADITVPARMAGYGHVAVDYAVQGALGVTLVDLNAGYAYRAMLGSGTSAVGLLGQTIAVPSLPGNQHLVYAGADFVHPLSAVMDLNVGGTATLGQNYLGGQAQISVSGRL